MIDTLLSFVAPHLCSGCGLEGAILCNNCKYDITSEPFDCCLACGSPAQMSRGVCRNCTTTYSRAWCIGERAEALHNLIEHYKFYRAKQAHKPLAALLDETLPVLPENTIVVPVPTLQAHIRQRGYDHVALITREFAKRRHLETMSPILRLTRTKQLGASRAERLKQAKQAFGCSQSLDNSHPYLVVDDVVTTGATLEYTSRALRAAGATEIWAASISRQIMKI